MEICCASKAAIKNIKIARKKQPFPLKKYNKIYFSQKIQISVKKKAYDFESW